jgi:signal transduction histidine kinase
MRSLRARFFLIVWPLVVLALVLLGLYFNRSTRIEFATVRSQVDTLLPGYRRIETAYADSIAVLGMADSLTLSRQLSAWVARESGISGLLVVDTLANVIATSLESMSAGAVRLREPGLFVVNHAVRTEGGALRVVWSGAGQRIGTGEPARYLIALPGRSEHADTIDLTPEVNAAQLSAIRRRITFAVITGSILAGLATLLLARPVVGRVTRLSAAANRIRRGDLAVRVDDHGRDELAGLSRSFNEMAEALQRSHRERRRMINDVAHELRTPLTNLRGLVESVQDGLRRPDAQLIDALHEEVAILARLADDLQVLTLSDAGTLVVSLESLDAAAEAERALNAFPARNGHTRIVLESDERALRVRADRRRLGQVLRNLIQNALTHSPPDEPVRVRVAREDDQVAFTVEDRGPGIAPEHLPHIWDDFYRVDPSRDRRTGGSGLGLAVVRRLVQAQGGTASVASSPGSGSSFIVRLPIEQL